MRLMRKQNGMIVPMKVSRWSISVWITDLKNRIGFLFLLLIAEFNLQMQQNSD